MTADSVHCMQMHNNTRVHTCAHTYTHTYIMYIHGLYGSLVEWMRKRVPSMLLHSLIKVFTVIKASKCRIMRPTSMATTRKQKFSNCVGIVSGPSSSLINSIIYRPLGAPANRNF